MLSISPTPPAGLWVPAIGPGVASEVGAGHPGLDLDGTHFVRRYR